jgi:hypothetical protein
VSVDGKLGNPQSARVRLDMRSRASLTWITLAAAGAGWLATACTTSAVATDANTNIGTILLTAYSEQGNLLASADVLVHDASGAVVAHGKTDAAGSYRYDAFPSSGMVTVVERVAQGANRIITVESLRPGQHVTTRPALISFPVQGQILVSPPPFAGASGFQVDAGCGTDRSTLPGGQVVLDITTGCLLAGNALRLVAYALDSTNQVVAYSVTGATFNPQPGVQQPVALAAWQTSLATVSLEPTNLPSPDAGAALPYRAFFAGMMSGPPPEFLLGGPPSMFTAAGTVPLRYAPATYDVASYVVTHEVCPSSACIVGFSRAHVPASGDYHEPLDVGQSLPPGITAMSVDRTDVVRPSVVVSSEAPLLGFDAAQLDMAYGPEGGSQRVLWTLIVPGDALPSVRVPALADPVSDLAPTVDDNHAVASGIAVDLSTVASYSAYIDAVPSVARPNTAVPPSDGGSIRWSQRR